MKYETNVIHKGVFYPSGTDVPVKETKRNKNNSKKNGTPSDEKSEETSNTNDGEHKEDQGE